MLKKRNIFISIILFILAFSLITEVNSFYTEIEKEKENFYENSKKVYDAIIDQQTKNINTIALLLANDEIVKNAYIQDDPELIKKHLWTYWQQVKKDNLIYEIHFFKPPAESFVNFSNFSSIGTDVSDVRTDIKWVTSSFKNRSHIMMCKTFAGIRGTFPIMSDKNEILGGLSLGKKIDWLPNTIKRLTNNDSFLVYSKKSANSLVGKYYDNFLKNKQILGNYILGDKTLNLSEKFFENIDFNKKIQDLTIDKNIYSLNIFPIFDFEKNLLAYVCVLNNLEPFYTKFYTKTKENIILLLIAGFLVYIILNNKIDNILNEIKQILKITNDIKNNNFEKLKNINHKSLTSRNDALINLESNVIEMGKTIQEQFEEKDKLVSKQAKMAAMGEMLDNIAHQWRQPLSVIKINATGIKLQKECGISSETQEAKMLDNIVSTSDYLSETIDDFRNFLKDDKKIKEFLTKDTFNKTKSLNLPSLKTHDIEIIEEIENIKILGFENELIQVFMNLINNSKDAFTKQQKHRYIFVTIKNNDEKIIIEFKDNAGGIKDKFLEKVFEERFTTKEKSGGTGVGLYISKKIIEQSFKGEMSVSNEEFEYNNTTYRGAKFNLILPLYKNS